MNKRQKRKLANILIALLAVAVVVLQQRGYLSQPVPNANQTVVEPSSGLYRVTKFIDGDTIQVEMQGKKETVRLIGLDTPETKDPRKPVQCFGQAAANFTENIIGENLVRLEADSTNSDRDRYQRLLRYVYLKDETLVNKQIISEGYGFALVSFPFLRMEEFKAAQTTARQQNKGLWGSCNVETRAGSDQTRPE